jgi:hypothetical protein
MKKILFFIFIAICFLAKGDVLNNKYRFKKNFNRSLANLQFNYPNSSIEFRFVPFILSSISNNKKYDYYIPNIISFYQKRIKKIIFATDSKINTLNYIDEKFKDIQNRKMELVLLAKGSDKRIKAISFVTCCSFSGFPVWIHFYYKMGAIYKMDYRIFYARNDKRYPIYFPIVQYNFSIIKKNRLFKIENISMIQENCESFKGSRKFLVNDSSFCFINAVYLIYVRKKRVIKIERFLKVKGDLKKIYIIRYNKFMKPYTPIYSKYCCNDKLCDKIFIYYPLYLELMLKSHSIKCIKK